MTSNNLDTAFVNLKVLSKLQPYERLNTRQPYFYVEKDMFPLPIFLVRWWRNDGRGHCVVRLNELYTYILEIVVNADEALKTRIGEHLHQSSIGLNNLKKTYAEDKTTISHIENILDRIQTHIIIPPKKKNE